MRKRIGILLLLAALLLSACGGEKPAVQTDLEALYTQLAEKAELPEMVQIPDSRRGQILGVQTEDCKQAVTAVCADSVRADEIWLIEAADADAAGRIAQLARQRIDQRSGEMENYLPDQYAVLQQAELVQEGNYVALFVSPQAAELASAFREALGR